MCEIKKICKKCKEEKCLSEFHKNSSSSKGVRPQCKECRKPVTKMYHDSRDPILVKEYSKNYRESNKNYFLEYARTYHKERTSKDSLYKISKNIRSLIQISFKNKYEGGVKTNTILGCSMGEFADHIERQFTKDMSWDKMGKYIHLDHIIPVSSAKTEEELIKLNHWSNFQPLWSGKNLNKGYKIFPVTNIELNLTVI